MLLTAEYDEQQKQMKNLRNELQTLELALELKTITKKKQSRNGDTWHPGKKSETAERQIKHRGRFFFFSTR